MPNKIKKTSTKLKEISKKTKIRVKKTIEKHPKLTSAGKTIIKLIGIGIIFFFLFIFIYVIINYKFIGQQVQETIGGYGYLAMFLISFLLDILFQPIGPELPLTIGLLTKLNPLITIILVILGSISASFLSFFLGKKYGELGIKKLYKNKVYNKWSKYYNKYGKFALTISALTPIPYVPFCWFSGILNMKNRTFFLFAIFPRIIRIIFVGLIVLALT